MAKRSSRRLGNAAPDPPAARTDERPSAEAIGASIEALLSENEELRERLQALGAEQSDLLSHYSASRIATFFLDRALRLIRFTPSAVSLLGLAETDLGRPLSDFAPRFGGESLLADAQVALSTAQPVERLVRAAEDGRWLLVRLVPGQIADHAVAELGLTFVEVTGLARAREEHHEWLFMLSPDAVFVWRLHGGIETWNLGAQVLYGFTLEEARGREAHELLRTVAPCPLSEVEAALRERGRWDGDLVRLAKGGRVVAVSATLQLVPGENGFARVLETNRDITDRKRAEEERRASEERLNRAQEIAHLGSWDLDLLADRLTWSDEVYRIFGLEPQAFGATYEAFLAAVHPDDRAAVDAAYSESLREGRDTYQIEHRVVRPSGEIRTVYERCGHIRDPSGRIVRSVGTVYDVTERKEMESRLAWLASFPEQVPVPIAEVDRGGRVHYMNPAAKKFFPDLPEKQRAHPWLADWDAVMGELGRTEEPLDRVVAVGDSYFHQMVAAIPEAGRVRVYGADITGLKRAEQALERSRQSLEEIDRNKNQFLAVLSHELRNPLTPIRSSLFILDRVAPGGEQALRARRVIERQTAHLTRLVDDLLDVTRISRGMINLQLERLDLHDLVRRATDDHRALFARAGVELHLQLADGRLYIEADRTRITQIIGNLLQNAVKFTGQGGTTTVAVEREEPAGLALIRVRDTGAGISADMVPRLFQPFTQADRTLDRSRGGLGLGLALVKGLVEIHHGTVEASSPGVGSGAEFTVRLPLDRGAIENLPTSPASMVAPRRMSRILVIEDNTDAAQSLKEALELGGHEVAVAHDGNEGLSKARESKPDVVLCDIGLPAMDGFEVARAFRADPALRGTRLVAVSGYASPEDQQRATESGFEQHVAKPPNLEELQEQLARMSSPSEGVAPGESPPWGNGLSGP